jgi:hypothetical protein
LFFKNTADYRGIKEITGGNKEKSSADGFISTSLRENAAGANKGEGKL